MTRQEQIQFNALLWDGRDYEMFIEGAEWADENPDYDNIFNLIQKIKTDIKFPKSEDINQEFKDGYFSALQTIEDKLFEIRESINHKIKNDMRALKK